MIILQGCDFLYTGDGIHRVHAPAKALGKLPGVTVIDCHLFHPSFLPLTQIADVMIVPYCEELDLLQIMFERRARGQISIFETDDFYHDPQPWNPVALGLRPSVRSLHRALVSAADAIQTSTAYLGEVWAGVARRVGVFPNYLESVPDLQAVRDRPFTIGWAGSQGHLADWYSMIVPITSWLESHPEVRLAIMGHVQAREFLSLAPERVLFRQAGTLAEYCDFLHEIDIGFAPLLDTRWNRGRSDVKFIEYAAHGVVGIFSDLGPYNSSVQDGVNGFLCGSPEQAMAKLDLLFEDRNLLTRMREEAHRYVREERVLENHITARVDFYRELNASDLSSDQIPSELLRGAVIEDGYIRIDRDEATQYLYDLQEKKRNADDGGLQALAASAPDYYLGQRRFAAWCLEKRQTEQAMYAIHSALRLFPKSAYAERLHSLALYQLGRPAEALAAIERSIRIQPHHPESWKIARELIGRYAPDRKKQLLNLHKELVPDNYHIHFELAPLVADDAEEQYFNTFFDLIEQELPEVERPLAVQFATQLLQRAFSQPGFERYGIALIDRALNLFPQNLSLRLMAYQLAYRAGNRQRAETHIREARNIKAVLRENGLSPRGFSIEYHLPEIVLSSSEG